MKELSREDVDALITVERFVLFVFVFNKCEYDAIGLRRLFIEGTSQHIRIDEMVSVCDRLFSQGLLSLVHRYAAASRNSFTLSARLDHAALHMLLQWSVEGDWWRIFGLNSNAGQSLSDQRGRFASGGGLRECQTTALLMRCLIDNAGIRADLTNYYSQKSEYYCAALDLENVLSKASVWPWPLRPFDTTNPFSLHKELLAVLFVHGYDVRPCVAAIGKSIAEGVLCLTDAQLCEIASLAILTGVAMDWRLAKTWKVSDEARSFAGLGDVLRMGDLATADKMCIAAVKAISGLSTVSAPAFNLLAILVNSYHKASWSRLVQSLKAFCPNTSYRYYEHSSGERRIIDDRNRRFPHIASVATGVLCGVDLLSSADFIDNLALPVWAQTNGIKREKVIGFVETLLKTAEMALIRGYPTIAGVYLSSFGWALPRERQSCLTSLAVSVTEARGVLFRPIDSAATEWKRIVTVLDERLPKTTVAKTSTSTRIRTGQIIWAIAIDSPESYLDGERRDKGMLMRNLFCARIVPCFRGPRAPEDGSADKTVTLKSIYSGKYDGCMTDADRSVVSALKKVNYNGPRGDSPVPPAALEALCGQDNVTSYVGDEYVKNFKPIRAVLNRQDIPVVGKAGRDGAVLLTVPHWSLTASQSYVLRMTGEQNYAYYPTPREVRSVLEVFRDFGDKGSLELPKEALTAARPVLGRLAAVLPMQGTLADIGGSSDAGGMVRINGDATPLIRLSLEDLKLHISLRVRPVPEAAETLFAPGVGLAERTLKLAKGPVILVRDLAREKAGIASIEQVLAEFESWHESAFEWHIDEAADALGALAAIQSLGASAHVEWQPGKRLSVMRPAEHPAVTASLGADQWFAFSGNWKLDDGRLISFAHILENLNRRVGAYVPIDDKGYLALNCVLLQQLDAIRTASQMRKGTVVVSPAALPMLDSAFSSEKGGMNLPEGLKVAADRIREVFASLPPVPSAFVGIMRPYQVDGYRWLSRLCDCGIGACLADDMGLGKTIQLIALLVAKRSSGPSLIVAPASVAFNWRNELERFAPSLRVALIGQVAGVSDGDVASLAQQNDAIITSYGVVATRQASFASVKWNVLILDEAQAIKNHLTQRARCVKELKARFRVAATGTPVENRLTELWSIFDFLNPGMLGGETRFLRELAPHGEASSQLKRLVKPLILRRVKRDVLTDLPDKDEIIIPVVLGVEERHAYEAMRRFALAKLEGADNQDKIAILAELTRLRRFCCHPSLVMPSLQDGAKLQALEGLLANLRENGHRALIFSQFVDFLSLVRQRLDANGWTYEYLDGATPKTMREMSVARFQSGEGDFFLISLRAGGMGLNLTAANYVILLDPWWNPAVENQAADRVHRIGQKLPVTVYRLIAQDTIEERVVNLHAKKTALAEDILATGAAGLSAEAMLGLLKG